MHDTKMPSYLGALTIVVLLAMVLARVQFLKKRGVVAIKFGELDKSDFLIPPFALFYFYLIFAGAFHWPNVLAGELFHSVWIGWIGVSLCALALLLIFASLISFGESFRIGIDTVRPDKLVTSGIFGLTRNPMYVAFGLVLLGELLIQPNWIFLAYLVGGVGLFHRQVLREEGYLREHYGEEFRTYRARVRRYL
jgi:protein-S-isoprenylcysteine O-methyltransferase Ste14